MRQTLSTFVVGSLFFGCVGFAKTGEKSDARAIIDQSIKAMGGETNLAKHKALTWKAKGTYYGMGDGLPYTANYSLQWPSQFRMEIEGVFTIIVNANQGWMKTAGGVMDIPKEQLDVQKFDNKAEWITTLLPLKDKAFTLKDLGEAKVEKKTTRVVQVSRKDYPEVKLYFDKKTNLLAKSEFRTKSADQEFKEVTMESLYSDYRDVDGAKAAHKLVINRDGKVFVDAEITEMKTAAKIDDKVFAKPAE